MRSASITLVIVRKHRLLTLGNDNFLLFGVGRYFRSLLDILDISQNNIFILELILIKLLLSFLVNSFLHHNFSLNFGEFLLFMPNSFLQFMLVRLNIIILKFKFFLFFFFQLLLNNFFLFFF